MERVNPGPGEGDRRQAVIAATVGLVLADSSIVVLALPEIYREFDVSVSTVVWVLVSFNLVLAAAAVPAARAAGVAGPGRLTIAGLLVFGAASLACGLAPTIEVLLAARCVQALGGAAAVCASLELLPSAVGSERRAVRVWAAAGGAGAALGPGAGGLLTELISWQSIFLVQVPLTALLALPLIATARREAAAGPQARVEAGVPHVAANAALGLVSAALAAALFLVVLLLIEGWRLSPVVAAATVSAMPAAALATTPVARRLAVGVSERAAAGVILIAGGLGGLALMPGAAIALTLAPQLLVGAGLALAVSGLTEAALEDRPAQAVHGGYTIAARHLGVVAGLLVLTPVLTADLDSQRRAAEEAGTAALLDARIDPSFKIELAERIADRLRADSERVPVVGPAFEPPPADPAARSELAALRDRIEAEVDRAATHAFSRSFGIATAFALAALLPLALARRRRPS